MCCCQGTTRGPMRVVGRGVHQRDQGTVRIAAAGDVHCGPHNRDETLRAFAGLEGRCDLVLLAGDLTTHGHPEQAAIVVEAAALDRRARARGARQPRPPRRLRRRGRARPRGRRGGGAAARLQRPDAAAACRSGSSGRKGFVGGFPGSSLPDFGEPLLREVYAETTREAEAIDRGLQAVAHCAIRVVLLHYAPVESTLEGEPEGIHTFLGLRAPRAADRPPPPRPRPARPRPRRPPARHDRRGARSTTSASRSCSATSGSSS